MKILFFSHYFPPEGNAPASRTYENARRWLEEGHQVTVITSAPNVPAGVVYDGYKNRLKQTEIVDGIRVIRVWTYIAPNKGMVRRTANYLSYMVSAFLFSLLVTRPDVIIATSPQFFCGWAGVLASRFRRVPFILEIRDIWPESIVAVGANLGRKSLKILEWLESKMYNAADHIVTVGEGYRRRLLEKGVEEEKIAVITNGVNRELFQPRLRDEKLQEKWGVAGKFICGYCGTIGMASGLHIVLDAAKRLKEQGIHDVVFLLVGDGAFRASLQQQARTDQLDNVVFCGRQPKEAMPDFLALSDVCLVHLRKTDLFTTVMPSKIFEAAAMAKPILNGVQGFAAKFMEKADAGINIEPENSHQLVDKLLSLKENHVMRQRFGKAARNYVLQHFDRDRLANQYLELIEKICSQPEGWDAAEQAAQVHKSLVHHYHPPERKAG